MPRARLFSLSLSFPSQKYLSRFEEVLGVFISCAYLFCLCGKKKNFSKLFLFFCIFKEVQCKHIWMKKGGRQTKEKFSTLSSFLDTKEHCWLLLRVTRKNIEYYSPRRVVPKERERERDEEIIARGSHNCPREEKNIVVIFSQKISPSNAARGNQRRRRRGRTKSSRERLTDDGAKKMEQRTRSIVRRRKFSEQCSF